MVASTCAETAAASAHTQAPTSSRLAQLLLRILDSPEGKQHRDGSTTGTECAACAARRHDGRAMSAAWTKHASVVHPQRPASWHELHFAVSSHLQQLLKASRSMLWWSARRLRRPLSSDLLRFQWTARTMCASAVNRCPGVASGLVLPGRVAATHLTPAVAAAKAQAQPWRCHRVVAVQLSVEAAAVPWGARHDAPADVPVSPAGR